MKKTEISNKFEYYKFEKAAKLLGYSPLELLHIAIIEKIPVSAPVVAAGEFKWPVGLAADSFPEIGTYPFVRTFDAADRVVLSVADLSRIEAMGWVIPNSFHAPSCAQEAIKGADISFERLISERKNTFSKNSDNENLKLLKGQDLYESIVPVDTKSEADIADFSKYGPTPEVADDWQDRRIAGFNSPWVAVSQGAGLEETKIEHLFIATKDVKKLIDLKDENAGVIDENDILQVPLKLSEKSEHYAEQRVEYLMAAIYCKEKYPEKCKNQTAWARTIDEMSLYFWGDRKPPNTSIEHSARILGEAIKIGKRNRRPARST